MSSQKRADAEREVEAVYDRACRPPIGLLTVMGGDCWRTGRGSATTTPSRGPNGADPSVRLAWTTTESGAGPSRTGAISVVQRGSPSEVELLLQNVADRSAAVTATVRVAAADGASLKLGPYVEDTQGCTTDDAVFLRGSRQDVRRATALGPAPFAYSVEVVINGVTHTGTGTWPRDQRPRADGRELTQLVFDPPLPRVVG